MYRKFFKRLIDILVCLVALPFFLLIFIVVAPIIKLSDGGPVFYNAPRLGYKGKIFKMYKFRSMRVNAPDIRNADGTTYNGKNDPRVTKIGKFLRETSLDETPQIFNVLKGDMCIIGRRAFLTTDYEGFDKLEEAEKRRLASRLGFEGLNRVFEALCEAEFSVKSGARTPLQAMEELVAQLSLIFGAKQENQIRR